MGLEEKLYFNASAFPEKLNTMFPREKELHKHFNYFLHWLVNPFFVSERKVSLENANFCEI